MPSRVSDLLSEGRPTFSFELFPPKTEQGLEALWRTVAELERLGPDFVSVTYGAGGTTRDRTLEITRRLALTTDLLPVGHLTCVGAGTGELEEVVDQFAEAGVSNILALRGDPPGGPGAPWVPHPGGLDHADQLVRLIRSRGDFTVGVAAFPDPHPALRSAETDAAVLARKEQEGAEFAVSQFFFRAGSYERMVDRSRRAGCTIPIIPGLMPVTNVAQIERFAGLSGAEFPPELARRFHELEADPEGVQALGVEVTVDLGRRLLAEGAPGLHFYTLNRSRSTLEAYRALASELG